MKGRIKTYNEDRGFGFIRCFDDNQDYFFHISEVLSEEEPNRGRPCEFDVGVNNKGFAAVNVKLTERKKEAQFIVLDDVRIPLDDIKNYGISYDEEEVKNPEYKSASLGSKMLMGSYSDSARIIGTCFAVGELLTKNIGVSRTLNVKRAYLYITLYTRGNFTFYEDMVSFDIFEKCKELDKYFGTL